MKRLLAGGMKRIYSLGKVFRRKEAGAQHNPEFTMLEWYRAGEGWQAIADDVETLVRDCAREFGTARAGACELDVAWERISVADACEKFGGLRIEGDESVDELRGKMQQVGQATPNSPSADWSDHFFQFFLDRVDQQLGAARPTILFDWPRPLCALAREKPGDARVVERFEAYAAGLELCNGFGELTDPVEQRRRMEADLAERRGRGLAEYPVDEKFLAALGDMPPSAGVALGVDRLAMLVLGARDIREVVAFTDDEL